MLTCAVGWLYDILFAGKKRETANAWNYLLSLTVRLTEGKGISFHWIRVFSLVCFVAVFREFLKSDITKVRTPHTLTFLCDFID